MSSESPSNPPPDTPFSPPPVTPCICAPSTCLSIGRKLHSQSQICPPCLLRHDLHHLHHHAADDPTALSTLSVEITRRQTLKSNLEAHGRFLCAFEDPDFRDCPWRAPELNLKDMRVDCKIVKMKGQACVNCWRGHLLKIGIVQYFTPWGVCHEGVGGGDVGESTGQRRGRESGEEEEEEEEEEDDDGADSGVGAEEGFYDEEHGEDHGGKYGEEDSEARGEELRPTPIDTNINLSFSSPSPE